uniref:C2H2-type domain-containing protein n=1 Tax=Timema cristinae TaxID=61476 RepID=A0A7R9D7T2_TIMCR|nr:unnamed protein product [Timema cristinae]
MQGAINRSISGQIQLAYPSFLSLSLSLSLSEGGEFLYDFYSTALSSSSCNVFAKGVTSGGAVGNEGTEKPHKCGLCSKSFPTPGDLKSHMYVHNGSWPFKCHICNRGFSKHTNLKNHLFLHTDMISFDFFVHFYLCYSLFSFSFHIPLILQPDTIFSSHWHDDVSSYLVFEALSSVTR